MPHFSPSSRLAPASGVRGSCGLIVDNGDAIKTNRFRKLVRAAFHVQQVQGQRLAGCERLIDPADRIYSTITRLAISTQSPMAAATCSSPFSSASIMVFSIAIVTPPA